MMVMSITQRSYLSYVGSDFFDGVFEGTGLSLIVGFCIFPGITLSSA